MISTGVKKICRKNLSQLKQDDQEHFDDVIVTIQLLVNIVLVTKQLKLPFFAPGGASYIKFRPFLTRSSPISNLYKHIIKL